jgi:hypothetical protein
MNTLTIVFAFIMVVLSIAAVKTVIPNAQASKACLLGYKAVCSFTPISTAILVAAVVITFLTAKGLAVM